MAKNLATIYIVRHGQTQWNIQGILQGHTDVPLNKKGEEQARAMAKELSKIHFDEAFSSDLLRAKRTAEIVSAEHKLVVKTTQALRERYFGKFQGKPVKIYTNKLQKLLAQYESVSDNLLENAQIGNVETIRESGTRLINFLREIAVAYPGKTILVVTHGGIMRYVLIKLGLGTHKTLPSGSISNLGFVKLQSDGVDFFIKQTKGINLVTSN